MKSAILLCAIYDQQHPERLKVTLIGLPYKSILLNIGSFSGVKNKPQVNFNNDFNTATHRQDAQTSKKLPRLCNRASPTIPVPMSTIRRNSLLPDWFVSIRCPTGDKLVVGSTASYFYHIAWVKKRTSWTYSDVPVRWQMVKRVRPRRNVWLWHGIRGIISKTILVGHVHHVVTTRLDKWCSKT